MSRRICKPLSYKSPFRRLSVGGTNSNKSLPILRVADKIILKRSYTTKHGQVSRKDFLQF